MKGRGGRSWAYRQVCNPCYNPMHFFTITILTIFKQFTTKTRFCVLYMESKTLNTIISFDFKRKLTSSLIKSGKVFCVQSHVSCGSTVSLAQNVSNQFDF